MPIVLQWQHCSRHENDEWCVPLAAPAPLRLDALNGFFDEKADEEDEDE